VRACDTTSIKDLNEVKLNARLKSGEPSQVGILPATDFAPDRVNVLSKKDVSYNEDADRFAYRYMVKALLANVG
jgi:hypothetical protein